MSLQLLAMWSQIVGAIVFVLVAVWIWNRYIKPGVKAYQASKNAELADAEGLGRERLRAECATARAELEAAEEQAKEIRARVALAEKREHAQATEAANAEAASIVTHAEGELERARFAARDKLRVELIEKALRKARAEAARRVDDAVNLQLVDRTVTDLAENKR